MDTPAHPPSESAPSIRARIDALEQHTRTLRLDLKDSWDLAERLKEYALNIQHKIVAAEQELILLRKEAEGLLKPLNSA